MISMQRENSYKKMLILDQSHEYTQPIVLSPDHQRIRSCAQDNAAIVTCVLECGGFKIWQRGPDKDRESDSISLASNHDTTESDWYNNPIT